MNIFQKAKLVYQTWRAYRKGIKMATSLTGATTSTTTQNVAMSGGAIGLLDALMVVVTSLVPAAAAYLTPEVQGAILVLAGTVAVPLGSRIIAFWRHPEKALIGVDPPALPVGFDTLTVKRIQFTPSGAWEQFDGGFEGAVAVGAMLVHCSNANVYRANGELVGHLELPPSLR